MSAAGVRHELRIATDAAQVADEAMGVSTTPEYVDWLLEQPTLGAWHRARGSTGMSARAKAALLRAFVTEWHRTEVVEQLAHLGAELVDGADLEHVAARAAHLAVRLDEITGGEVVA